MKLIKNILYRKTILETKDERKPKLQVILPGHLTTKVLNGLHNQVGHQGIVRTLSLLRERFLWPGMHRDATQYVNKCQNCLKRKASPHVAPLQPIIANQPMELVLPKGILIMYLSLLIILLDMLKPTLVKPKQHKPLLNCFGKILLDIMAFQKSSCQIKEETLRVIDL